MRPSTNILNSVRNCVAAASCGPGNCGGNGGVGGVVPGPGIPSNEVVIVVMADSAAATLYAYRVIRNITGTSATVVVLNQGPDNIANNIDDITDVAFPVLHVSTILNYLKSVPIHLLPENVLPSDPVSGPFNKIINYYLGAGPNGDAIAQYHVPYIGPWFYGTSNPTLTDFFTRNTVIYDLNVQEKMIVNRLSTLLNIPVTRSPFVKSGAIINRQIALLSLQSGTFGDQDLYMRNLFLDQYNTVLHNTNAKIFNNVPNIVYQKGNPACPNFYNLNPGSTSNISIECVRPSFKMDPFAFLRLAALSGVSNRSIYLPTFYRAVIPIPLNNSSNAGSTFQMNGIDFSSITPTSDLIYTHNSFSLGGAKNSNGVAWIFDVYTTSEDLSLVTPNNVYSGQNGLLLIVEAYSLNNVRLAQYDLNTQTVILQYNCCRAEEKFLIEFAGVVSLIYLAMVGATIDPASIISNASVCYSNAINGSSVCQDASYIRDFPLRQSPLTYIAILASVLYGVRIIPNP